MTQTCPALPKSLSIIPVGNFHIELFIYLFIDHNLSLKLALCSQSVWPWGVCKMAKRIVSKK
jgi:hypothetical protein